MAPPLADRAHPVRHRHGDRRLRRAGRVLAFLRARVAGDVRECRHRPGRRAEDFPQHLCRSEHRGGAAAHSADRHRCADDHQHDGGHAGDQHTGLRLAGQHLRIFRVENSAGTALPRRAAGSHAGRIAGRQSEQESRRHSRSAGQLLYRGRHFPQRIGARSRRHHHAHRPDAVALRHVRQGDGVSRTAQARALRRFTGPVATASRRRRVGGAAWTCVRFRPRNEPPTISS